MLFVEKRSLTIKFFLIKKDGIEKQFANDATCSRK
jgi:hypothetical protein